MLWFLHLLCINDLGLPEAAQQACVAAAESGHDQVLEFLLDMSEVDVNRQDTLTGETGWSAYLKKNRYDLLLIYILGSRYFYIYRN